MGHVLEHVPWLDVPNLLKRVHSWMLPDAKITIEVPDMRTIAPEVDHPHWLLFVYGVQTHPGEFHRCGFTEKTLELLLERAGFHDVTLRKFISAVDDRFNMPCLEAVAFA